MNIPNTPEEKVMVELDRDIASLLSKDADSAVHQLLSMLMEMQNSSVSENTVRQLAELMDAKRHLKDQIGKALEGL